MRMRACFGVVLGLISPGRAVAEHDHGGGEDVGATSAFGAAVAVVAARFDTMLYAGDYEGISPSLRWSDDRFAVVAAMPGYRVHKNGKTLYGPGDAVVHGVASIVRAGATQAGGALAVSLPTGDDQAGLGMGHVMVMPGLWASHALGRVTLGGSVGYGRALGGERDHDHGAWPLVDPMNVAEVTWSATTDVALGETLHAGVRIHGAIPTRAAGDDRIVGGVRLGWSHGRVATAATLQAGLAGDPFTMRGVLETALRF